MSPGLIPNPSLRPTDATSDQFVVAGRAIKRTQVPEDMVGTILHLAGSGSDLVSVDGQARHGTGPSGA